MRKLLIFSILLFFTLNVSAQEVPAFWNFSSVSFDIDNDGDNDVIIIGNSDLFGPSLLFNQGNYNFSLKEFNTPDIYNTYYASADFNKDGFTDFIAIGYGNNSDEQSLMFFNDSGKTFSLNPKLNFDCAGESHYPIAAIDYNNDSFPDIVIANDSLLFYKNNHDSTFTYVPPQNVLNVNLQDSGINVYNVIACDYNNDNLQDLIIENIIFKNNGNGTFSAVTRMERISSPLPIHFFGKDTIDFVGFNSGDYDTLIIYKIRGDTVNEVYKPPVQSQIKSFDYMWVADFNKDGYDDMVFQNYNETEEENETFFMINDQNGDFNDPKELKDYINANFSVNQSNLYINTFNSDSFPDILLAGELQQSFTYQGKTQNTSTDVTLFVYSDGNGGFFLHETGLNDSLFSTYSTFDFDMDDFLTSLFYNDDSLPDLLMIEDLNTTSREQPNYQPIVMINNGDYSFSEKILPFKLYEPQIAVEDFNNDDKPDFTFYQDSVVYIYYNTGNDNFVKQSISLDIAPRKIAVFDLNQNGLADIVVNGYDNSNNPKTYIIQNINGYSFDTLKGRLPSKEMYGFKQLNFNGDTLKDYVFILENGTIILTNNGNYSFSELQDNGLPNNDKYSLYPFDYNYDGYDDLVVSGRGPEYSSSKILYYNDQGQGFVQDTVELEYPVFLEIAKFIDFDNDGYKDIFLYGVDVLGRSSYLIKPHILMNDQGHGFDFKEIDFPEPLTQSDIVAQDFNNDGRIDLAFIGFELTAFSLSEEKLNFYMLYNDSLYYYSQKNFLLPGGDYADIADFNKDGNFDIITTVNDNNYYSLDIYSAKNFSVSKLKNVQSAVEGIRFSISDFNNDGYPDIFSIYTLQSILNSAFFQNTGENKFIKLNTNITPRLMTTGDWGDFNNDGWNDLLLPGETDVYINKNGSFEQSGVNLDYSLDAQFIDYNKDGLKDIALISATDGKLKIYKKNRDNTVSLEYTFNYVGYLPYNLYVYDFDNDGWQDIILVTTNMFSNDIINLFFLHNENGQFKSQGEQIAEILTTNLGYYDMTSLSTTFDKYIYLDDYNQDGKTDIILSNLTPNFDTVSYIYLNYLPDSLSRIKIPARKGYTFTTYIDNDSTIDIVTTGLKDRRYSADFYLNKQSSTNQSPSAPSNLNFKVINDTVYLSWSPGSDAETPQAALTYNVYIYDNDGNFAMNTLSDHTTGKLFYRKTGNAGADTMIFITGLERGKIYHWSVQTVDQSFSGSTFAPEGMFTLPPKFVISPSTQEACEEGEIIFNSIAQLADSLHWQVDTGNGVFINLQNNDYFANATTPNLKVKNITLDMDGWRFRCKATNMGGDAFSAAATLHVQHLIKAFAGADTIVCSDTLQLFANSPLPASGYWTADKSFVSFDNPAQNNTVLRGLQEGTVTLTWTISQDNVCGVNSDQLVITRSLPVDRPTTPTGDNVCVAGIKEYGTLKLYNATDYQWQLSPDTAGYLTWTDNTATVSWNENFTDTAYLSVRAKNACGYSDWSVPLQVINYPTPDKPDIPDGATDVCASTPQQYTTSLLPGYARYEWNLFPSSAGTMTYSGNSVQVTWNPTFSGTASLKVRGSACDAGEWSEPLDITVYASAPPQPQTPTGDTSLCINSPNTVYTTQSVSGATSYQWSITSGAGTVSGTQTTAIVDWNSGFYGLAEIRVASKNACGTSVYSQPLTVKITNIPQAPITAPSGDDYVCNGSIVTYSGVSVPNATSYQWEILPDTAGVVSASDLNGIANFDETFTGLAQIRYKAVNQCGSSDWSPALSVKVDSAPDVPSVPRGEDQLCIGSNLTNYSIPAVDHAISYAWKLTPASAGSLTGNGTTVSVSWQAAFSGTTQLLVKAIGCRESDWSQPYEITVYPSAPEPPLAPAGQTDLCIDNPNTSYTITEVENASSYDWSLSQGADTVVQFGTSAIIDWNASFSGTSYLKVRASNICGTSNWSDSLEINVKLPPQIPAVPTGESHLCKAANGSYVTNDVTYASAYQWNVFPATAAQIIGSGTNITMDLDDNFEGTTYLKVRAYNNCGISDWSDSLEIQVSSPHPSPLKTKGNFIVICVDSGYTYQWYKDNFPIIGATRQYYYHNPLPSGVYQVEITDDYNCSAMSEGLEISSKQEKVAVFPNPATTEKITVEIDGQYEGQLTINLVSLDGKLLRQWELYKNASDQSFKLTLPHAGAGIYLLKIFYDNNIIIKRIKILSK